MKKNNWKGNEFEPGEIVQNETRTAFLKIVRWDKYYGGWWYCRIISNGGMHYTRLITKVKIN